MAGVGPSDLQDLAEDFLAACVEALDTIPTFVPGSVGSPARTFVSPGKPAYDCCLDGQLTVHRTLIQEGPAAKGIRENWVTLVATALRCIPMPEEEAPDPVLMGASAAQINMDAWALWNHIFNLVNDCQMLFSICCGVRWLGLQQIDAQGGCGGNILTLTVCLDGYEELCST